MTASFPNRARIGKYYLVEEAGRGGMSVVWKAWDDQLQRSVALKVFHLPPDHQEGKLLERFHREARIIAQLEHPNIVQVYEVGQEGQIRYIAMRWVEGKTLNKLEAEHLEPRKAAEIVRDAARGIEYIHKNGIIHRDLKPENIMVEDQTGKVLVMDFGLAKDLMAKRDDDALTRTGVTVGTPAFMSPEQAMGHTGEIDMTSDVFSLGATLYTLATWGTPPFVGRTQAEVMMAVLQKDPPDPRKIRPEIPNDLAAIVLHCLEKSKAARYPTAAALADDLDRFLRDEPIRAAAPTIVTRFARRARRHLAIVCFAVFSTIFVLGAGVAVLLMHRANVKRVEEARENQRRAEVEQKRRATVREESLLRADDCLRKGHAELGLAECRAAREADPNDARNFWFEGRFQELAKRRADALTAYNRALQIDPAHREARRDRGLLCLDWSLLVNGELFPLMNSHGPISLNPMGELYAAAEDPIRRAVQDFDRLREISDRDAERGYAEALLAVAERKLDRAIAHFDRCARDPFARDLGRWRAYALYRAGRYPEAAGEIDGHLATRIDDAHAHVLGALCEIGRNQAAAAESRCRKAVEVDPDCAPAHHTLALLLQFAAYHSRPYDLERAEEAEAGYDRALELDDGLLPTYLNRGLLFQQQQRYDEALLNYQKAIEKFPDTPICYNRRAQIYSHKGNDSAAIEDYGHAVRLDPRYYYGWVNRARSRTRLGEYRQAIQDYTEAAELMPNSGEPLAERGSCYYRLGEWANAIRDFEKAIALTPELKRQLQELLDDAKRKGTK